MSENQSLDIEAINELRELADDDDPDFFKEIIEEYVENASSNIAVLHEAYDTGDSIKLVRTAHTLKGASSNIGAVHLSEISKNIEHLARSESIREIRLYFEELDQEFSRVKKQLITLIDA